VAQQLENLRDGLEKTRKAALGSEKMATPTN